MPLQIPDGSLSFNPGDFLLPYKIPTTLGNIDISSILYAIRQQQNPIQLLPYFPSDNENPIELLPYFPDRDPPSIELYGSVTGDATVVGEGVEVSGANSWLFEAANYVVQSFVEAGRFGASRSRPRLPRKRSSPALAF